MRALSCGLNEAELTTPLGAGERSFKRDLTHLIYCAERGADPIHHALLLQDAFMPRIHAERDWGALMRYEAFEIAALMAYFEFRRAALLGILHGLSQAQWARSVRREGVRRRESVYYCARGLAIHELGHLEGLGRQTRPAATPVAPSPRHPGLAPPLAQSHAGSAHRRWPDKSGWLRATAHWR